MARLLLAFGITFGLVGFVGCDNKPKTDPKKEEPKKEEKKGS